MNFETANPGGLPTGWAHPGEGRYAATKVALRFRLYLALLAADVVSLLLSFAAADAIRFGHVYEASGANLLVVLLPIYLFLALNRRVYSSTVFARWRRAAVDAVGALVAAVVAVLFVGFFLHASASMSRAVMGVGVTTGAFLLVAARFVVNRLGRRLFGGVCFAELVLSDGVVMPANGRSPVLDAAALGLAPDIDDPRALDRLGRVLMRAERVIVACPPARREAWAAALKGANVRGEVIAPELASLGSLGAARFGAEPTLIVSVGPLGLRDRALKRGLDLALSLVILLFLAPLLAVVAAAIRLDSAGPVLFVQQRFGRGNRLFPMYKFRSMRADQCDVDGATSTTRDDARVTRVGRLIRASSIDELPQILNVLRGEMSIVGPRPHALGSLAGEKLFWKVDQRYWHRHATKPGITGLAQVRGFRGATHMQSDLIDRLQSDLDYLNGWTIWRDLSILFATFRVVLHRNAY